tara:strand:+ start:466 stop:2646 length:2181 start_codon:yes stop_codon:yes gene_type:complete
MAEEEKVTLIDTDQASDITPEGWTSAPTLGDLKQEQRDSKDAFDTQKNKIRGWLDNLHMEGSARVNPPKGYSQVQPRLIRKQAEWRYPALSEPFLSTEELYTLKPVTWEDKEPARQNQLVINNQMSTKIDKQSFIDDFVRATVDEGTAIVKLSWDFQEEDVTEDEPVYAYEPAPQMAELHEELHAMMESNPTGYEAEIPNELKAAHEETMRVGEPVEAFIISFNEVTRTKTVKNAPYIEVCDYRNVMPDFSCRGDLSKAGFIIHSYETTTSNLTKAGKYQNIDLINVEGATALADPDHEVNDEELQSFQSKDMSRKRVVAYDYWGYWDYDSSGIAKPIICTWVEGTMIRMEESPHPDGELPFVFVPALPVKGSLYGEPDGALLEDNQKIIGAITRGMVDTMGRSANGQMGTRKGALDSINLRRFQTGKDYQYNGNVDPRMAFFMHQYPELPASSQFMIELQNYEAESMTGVKAFSQGINSGALGEVATGINGALDSAAKRETGMLRRLASGMTKIGRKIIAMNSEFLEDEEIIRITNDTFVAIRRDDLQGKFDLVVDISTAEEDNAKAGELAMMLQTIGPNGDPELTKMILKDIATLRKMPGLAHQIEEFQPQPDPVQQELAQLEIELKKAEIMKVKSETAENFTDADLNSAKANTEASQSRKLNSAADKTDLDFVEQESGVTQERSKELQGEQARGNMQLEQVKQAGQMEANNASQLEQYLRGTK